MNCLFAADGSVKNKRRIYCSHKGRRDETVRGWESAICHILLAWLSVCYSYEGALTFFTSEASYARKL